MKKQEKLKPGEFESKWQKMWEEKRIYQPDLQKAKKPYYNLMMFPYPSAEGLHVGNMYAFTGADINGRYHRMAGYDVFEPIGLDGFGIHSENYAIKIGKHPAEQAKISEANFYRQLRSIGNGFAWENHLETYDPDYYKWTQWIFGEMFRHGLAYRKKSPVNFCPSCKTVLSDEQVINGACERCKTIVEKREMEQWFFRITKYAERLLQNTYRPGFLWTEKVKTGQRNWIGKKEGINITYPVVDGQDNPLTTHNTSTTLSASSHHTTLTCFTTRPDTNFGATFIVIGPEHTFVDVITDSGRSQNAKAKQEMKKYVEKATKTSEADRIAAGRKKTGVFTGFYAVNQLTDYKMPIYISDFVLGHVGTGAVAGVPGHDLRDFEFARAFKLPIKRVVTGRDGDRSEITRPEHVQEEEGTMINSGFLDGMDIHKAIPAMMDHLEKKGWGKRVTTYKLRDWCISRQRYWGAPIPMVDCPKCGWVAVPEKDLPVLLPQELKDWKPEGTGKGPLAKLDSFVNTTCPECRGEAKRETDVCDTFLDSSWYHLRYPSVNQEKDAGAKPKETISKTKLMPGTNGERETGNYAQVKGDQGNLGVSGKFVSEDLPGGERLPWDREITKKWLPVTQYIGGAEHTVLHLLYARFVAMALSDWGYIGFDEPYARFYAHGLIIKDGAKMSKSSGNVVIPDEYIAKYGADTLRTYLMFVGPYDAGGDFRDTGIAGMYRFLGRVFRLVNEYTVSSIRYTEKKKDKKILHTDLTRFMHRSIKEVTGDMEDFRYNTAIAHIMEFVNELQNFEFRISNFEFIKVLLLLLAPFAPHMTEELFQKLKSQMSNLKSDQLDKFTSIHTEIWPSYDEKYLVETEVTIVVQVNGKLRDNVHVVSEKSNDQKYIEEEAKRTEKVTTYLSGHTIRKVIFVPGKLINFVI